MTALEALADVIGATDVEFIHKHDTNLTGSPIGKPIWHVSLKIGGVQECRVSAACRHMPPTTPQEALALRSLHYVDNQIGEQMAVMAEQIENFRDMLARAEKAHANLSAKANKIAAFLGTE